MKTYQVTIKRTVSDKLVLEVEAEGLCEARRKALDEQQNAPESEYFDCETQEVEIERIKDITNE